MPATETDQTPPSDPQKLLRIVGRVAAELHPQLAGNARLDLDTKLDTELGFDSLGRLELVARIEREFGVRLADELFASAETPADLLRGVQEAAGPGVGRPRATTTQTPNADAASPDAATTLTEVLDAHVAAHGGRVHLQFMAQPGRDDVQPLTFAQLQAAARRVAANLQHLGLEAGDRVALMLPSGLDYFACFFGALYAGGIPVPLYPPARRQQLEDHMRRQVGILNNAGCRFMITMPEARALVRLLRLQVASLHAVVAPAELDAERVFYPQRITADDIAFLQYTSGSTGRPKGVILSHANLLANIRADGEAIEAGSQDVFVSWLPLYHDMGLIGAWLGSLYFAARLHIMSPLAFLARPERWLWALHDHGGTLSAAPNFAYGLCVARIDDRDLEGLDLSRWRLTLNGAEAISPDTLTAFERRFAPYGFRAETMFPVFGLAECSVGLTFPPLHRPPVIDRVDRQALARRGHAARADAADAGGLRFVACGRPLRGHEIRIVDHDGRELPERHEGRLQFRGPSATRGYFNNPAATEKLFDGDWLETGDRGYLAGGELYLTGRTKDMIIRAGRNIHPQELEEAIGRLPGIRDGRVAVFSDRGPGEETDRLVVLAETRLNRPDDRAALRRGINRLATELTWTAADEIVLAGPGAVLKTSSGKIRRAASRELWRRGAVGQRPAAVWRQLLQLALASIPGATARVWRLLRTRLYGLYARGAFTLTGAAAFLGVFLVPRSHRWRAMRYLGRGLARITGNRLTVLGGEQLPAIDRACVFVANHASYIDSYVLATALDRDLSFVAKAELRQQALSRQFLDRLYTCYVTRDDVRQGIADTGNAERAARAGRSLVFFPEGTFTRQAGLMPFHLGAFVVAAKTRTPVVPVAIHGTRDILRPGTWLPHHGAIRVTIGVPLNVPPDAGGEKETWANALSLRAAAREHILRHCGEPDRGAIPPVRVSGKDADRDA